MAPPDQPHHATRASAGRLSGGRSGMGATAGEFASRTIRALPSTDQAALQTGVRSAHEIERGRNSIACRQAGIRRIQSGLGEREVDALVAAACYGSLRLDGENFRLWFRIVERVPEALPLRNGLQCRLNEFLHPRVIGLEIGDTGQTLFHKQLVDANFLPGGWVLRVEVTGRAAIERRLIPGHLNPHLGSRRDELPKGFPSPLSSRL